MAVEDCRMATRSRVAAKVADINRLINHKFTKEELSEKLRKQNQYDPKLNLIKRMDLEREVKLAQADGNTEKAEALQKELDQLVNPTLSWGTTLNAAAEKPAETDKVYQINLRNQKLNYENVRRAQLEERKAARKAAAAVARGEAAADPFMRVRTMAKTHHDVSGKTQQPLKPADSTPTDTGSPATKAANTDSPARVSTPGASQTSKKSKSGFMISYRNTDDENIAALDLDIDIDI
jgi:RNA polymerase-associated protein RTF1